MNEDQAIAYLNRLIEEAERVIGQGMDKITITSTPSAMRTLRMRGELLCELHDGRRTYSLNANRLIKNCRRLIDEIKGSS